MNKPDKKIYFCVDYAARAYMYSDNVEYCTDYESTEFSINRGYSPIVTTSMAHFSFGLQDFGYEIYLCYGDNIVKIEEHMDLTGIGEPCKDLKYAHNLLKLFRAGVFNELLGINYGKE